MADEINITVIEQPIEVAIAITDSPIAVNIAASQGIEEAPIDGVTYGRKNAAWQEVVTSVAWGAITGTLSNQTDLQTALNAKQTLDATLTSIATLGTAADRMIYTTAVDTWAEATLTAFARSILDDANAAAVRATIGAGTGNGDLLAANNLSDLANVVTAWTNLGLGAAAFLAVPITAANGGTGIAAGASASLTLPNAATTITGGGTIALGTFTLTVPATGTAALLGVSNTFTTTNIFTDVSGLQAYTNGVTTNFIAGLGAGNATMTGVRNIIIGNLAGEDITDGEQNVCIGAATGRNITTGDNNLFIGFSAGRDCLGGSKNVAIGAQAGLLMTSGESNMLFGENAGSKITTASMNVMIGQQAGQNATSGNNVMIGSESGRFVTSGASNVFLGFKAGYRQTTLSNLFIIDNAERASAAVEITNSILYGVMATTPGAQTLRLNAVTSVKPDSALTSTLSTQFIVGHNSTGTPAAGFGLKHKYQLETSTTEDTDAASWDISHVVATHASRTERIQGFIHDAGGAREWIRGEASGTAAMIGFYGAAAAAQPAGIADADGTLADITTKFNSLIGKLETLGLLATV